MDTCGCEHIMHFSDDEAHEYLGVKVDRLNVTMSYIGPICDWCDENCRPKLGVWA